MRHLLRYAAWVYARCMRKPVFLASIFALTHASASLKLIPWANEAYQRWFDTGAPLSFGERVGNLVALVLSFPVALQTVTRHSARVSTQALFASVLAKSW